jgi:hypothetical protein
VRSVRHLGLCRYTLQGTLGVKVLRFDGIFPKRVLAPRRNLQKAFDFFLFITVGWFYYLWHVLRLARHLTKRSTTQPSAVGRSQARAGVRGVKFTEL